MKTLLKLFLPVIVILMGVVFSDCSKKGTPTSSLADTTTTVFTVWQTVELGEHASVHEYRTVLRENGWNIIGRSKWLIRKCRIDTTAPGSVELVKVTLADLGFTTPSATYEQVCARAKKRGLALCPNEVVLALCEQFSGDVPDNATYVMTKPVHGLALVNCYIFRIGGYECDSCLTTSRIHNDWWLTKSSQANFSQGCEFVFCKP